MFPFFPFPLPFFLYLSQNITNYWFRILPTLYHTQQGFFLGITVFSQRQFSLGDPVFSWRLGCCSAFAVFARRRGFRSASRFSLGVAVFARRCCFLLGLGLLFSTDFGSWLLPVAARSGLCSLSFHFPSPCSFTDFKILLTTGLGYCLPYMILSKVFFSAAQFSLGAGFLSAACFSIGGSFFARQGGFLLAARFSLGGSVFSRRRGVGLAVLFSPGAGVSS